MVFVVVSACGIVAGTFTDKALADAFAARIQGKVQIRTTFGSLPVGAAARLENTYGTKIEPIQCEQSAAFYRSQNARFDGWNFRCKFMGFGEEGLASLAPDTEVIVLDALPACYNS